MTKKIFSEMFKVMDKVYFFDIKKLQDGSRYIQISESRVQKNGEWRRSDITIFEYNLDDFIKVFLRIAKTIR